MGDLDLSAAVEAASWAETLADGRLGHDIAEAAVTAAAPLIEAQVRAQVAHLLPAESLALTIALAQIRRGEPVTPNIAVMCTITLSRLAKGDS